MRESSFNGSEIRLDDLYKMTAHIYSEQNAGRTADSTFLHFVEVCGMLSSLDRNKPRGEVDIADALCKTLGWFFPLIAQFKVTSLERIIFRKYPGVCPYCRVRPHDDANCKAIMGIQPGILNHDRLRMFYSRDYMDRPATLDAWQQMFQEIYPRTSEDRQGRSTLGLLEELGELAEAIRVYDRHPMYFVGEAADVFSYLMGVANEYKLRHYRDSQMAFSFEAEYLTRYPGMCIECGYAVCRCPHVPHATIGRMAKELKIDESEELFKLTIGTDEDHAQGEQLANRVFARIGGYPSMLERFPFDRGQANQDLVQATLLLATALQDDYPGYAESLNRNALRLMQSKTEAGEREHSPQAADTIEALQAIFRKPEVAEQIATQEFESDYLAKAGLPSTVNVLLVHSSPTDRQILQIDEEVRIVQAAINRAKYSRRFNVISVGAARIDDVRRHLLDNPVAIVHFSGHGEADGLLFKDEFGKSTRWSYAALAKYLDRFPSIKCVLLNACFGAAETSSTLAGLTVGMAQQLADPAAIEFARGFYDALGAGYSYEFAAIEGELTALAKGYDALRMKMFDETGEITREQANKRIRAANSHDE